MSGAKQRKATRGSLDMLDPAAVECEANITRGTQRVWRSENRYGWRDLTIFVGDKPYIRRRDLHRWLESRRGVPNRKRQTTGSSAILAA